MVDSLPSVDLSTATTVGTPVVIGGATLYLLSNGNWVKAASAASASSSQLFQELEELGVKFSRANTVGIVKTPSGVINWLENGNSGAGLQHIMERHSQEFEGWGLTSESQVSQFILNTVKNGGGTPLGDNGARLYEVTINGVTKYMNVVTGSNGFIVMAYPYSP
ncbi:hypothetical protein [Pectinatus frisingensis]|uniref:hypothetical protein n=1 Tax=Pectinatus frisingensis TaxID=865 RepID=UPI0018C6BC40|nr:hypothetical protein [Pectinatus frisingensis]